MSVAVNLAERCVQLSTTALSKSRATLEMSTKLPLAQ